MELTIEQALQQGIAAHKEGKLQDAERLYRAILQSQPLHPDANHNLGVIAVSLNKADAALPLLKAALEANPKIEQFWLSYIGALIKERWLDNAKQVIRKAKNQGVGGARLNSLEKQLAFINKEKNIDNLSPSHRQLSNLSECYKNGRFAEAEKLAMSITHEFPNHQFGWEVLSAVLKQNGRTTEALNANQIAVALSPQDATAHSNLGATLKEMARLEESEVSYKRAIALKPDDSRTHNNLGALLEELDRLDEAEVSYTQAIALKPDDANAHSNLGVTLQKLGRLEEAEASYTQAIALKPDFFEAYYNLSNLLRELGRLDDAKASYGQSIMLKPDNAEAHNSLGITLQKMGRLEEAEVSLRQAIALKPSYAEAHNTLGVTLQKMSRLEEAEVSLRQAIALKPDFTQAHNSLLRCLYVMDKQSLFFDQLDYLINEDIANATIGSFTCRSALKYGVEKPNLFCREPLNYVFHIDLNTQYDFEEIFAEKAIVIYNENKIPNRKQSLLVNGSQTSGNLFDTKNSFTEQIQKVIRLEIEKYRINFKDSKDGLIKRWPTEYSLYGWLISMKSGGKLKPHIHSNGWLSGSFYINVPPKSNAESGNLVVSLGEENDATDTRINVEKIINVVTGSLVLFPASLTHYTIPFEAEEERIVLAFDVKQK